MRKIIVMLALLFSLFANVRSQESISVSADGGFAIGLPPIYTSSTNEGENFKNMYLETVSYIWNFADSSIKYTIQKMRFHSTNVGENPKLTIQVKKSIMDAFAKGLQKKASESDSYFKESVFSFEGNTGKELQVVFPTHRVVVRVFFVKYTQYSIVANLPKSEPSEAGIGVLNSFRLLTKNEIIDLKTMAAEPKPLPQSPISNKPISDSKDANLKGGVKHIIEEYQESLKRKRELWAEIFYNEQGNLTREIYYENNYPASITVWGFIDGNRVSSFKETNISFDDDPPEMKITQDAEDSFKSLPKDERFTTKFSYKYNADSQLIEKTTTFNNGVVSMRETNSYRENIKEITEYHEYPSTNKYVSKSIHVYNKNGDLQSETQYDYKGSFMYKTTYKYDFDTRGNWIVQRSFDEIKVKGKTISKPTAILLRKIVYYE